jgi:arsenite/tail-anchored protein-transporting ATPase
MRLIIYTGKGGTGKTVTSCSTAINLADRKYKTLIVSSDPAHTLDDAFRLPKIETDRIDNSSNETKQIIPNLDALQIDPVSEISTRYSSILTYMASIFSSKGIDEILAYELAMMPGMTQVFSLLRVEEMMRENSYNIIVIDMPASGEALRYLYFPKLVGGIGRRLTGLMGAFSGFSRLFQAFSGMSVPENVLQYEHDLFDRLIYLSDIIRDNNVTSLRLVANPDTFSIENAKRAFMSASLYGINVDLAVINKVMPAEAIQNDPRHYYANWTKFQYGKVEEAKANFYPLPVRAIPLHNSELAGIEMLRVNANLLFPNGEDPANTFYQGKPCSIIQENSDKLYLALTVPFTKSENFDIKRSGTDVIIRVKGPTGNLVNVIPLPTITFNMKLVEANMDNNVLKIFFEKTL